MPPVSPITPRAAAGSSHHISIAVIPTPPPSTNAAHIATATSAYGDGHSAATSPHTQLQPLPHDRQPLLLLAPGDRSWWAGAGLSWRTRLAHYGRVQLCSEEVSIADTPLLVRLLMRKIVEAKSKAGGRAVIIVGMSVGCKVAVLAALRERVDGVVCLAPHVQGSSAALLECVVVLSLLTNTTPLCMCVCMCGFVCVCVCVCVCLCVCV